MEVSVFDIETDGLDATKIHCLSYDNPGCGVETNYGLGDIEEYFVSNPNGNPTVGHNIMRYDIPTVERLLGITCEGPFVDTLALSWYLFPNLPSHGLEAWGEYFRIPKMEITDWENLSIEDYTRRCERDVEINRKLWDLCLRKLRAIYNPEGTPEGEMAIWNCCKYLTWKLECAAEQEQVQWKLDVTRAEQMVEKLEALRETKVTELKAVMPKVPVVVTKTQPKVMYKQDGTLSAHGQNWFKLLKEHKLPMTHKDPVKVTQGYEEPNPSSPTQVKDWLFSLGWEPATYNYVKNNSGEERAIPQVRNGDSLCESVLLLKDKAPEVEALEGLTVLNHRLAIFHGYLSSHKDGYLKATIQGFTNTLRFRHSKPLVNLPGVDADYGEDIRGCLLANTGEVLCGADLSSLEDTTKRHYIIDYDPEYVKEMQKPGFDPHLDLAKHAGAVTQEDIDKHNNDEIDLGKIRKPYKMANYSCTYGVGAQKFSRSMGLSLKESKKIIKSFWDRNWSITEVSKNTYVRTLKDGSMWLLNPVSGIYHSLRYEKDIFSTLNQSTGVWVFDNWVKHVRNSGIRLCGQFHDEFIASVPEEKREETQKKLEEALEKTNKSIRLNVTIGMEAKYGKTYADVH